MEASVAVEKKFTETLLSNSFRTSSTKFCWISSSTRIVSAVLVRSE